jgi:hypothetical protein
MGISNFIVEPMNVGFCCVKRLKKKTETKSNLTMENAR